MGNQPYNQSMYDYMMDNFKKNVRYILDSIIQYADYHPGMYGGEKVPDCQKESLKKFERDFKAYCIELHEDVTKYVTKIGNVCKRLDKFLKDHHCRPVWLMDEHDCLPLFNSMYIDTNDLDFDYKEQAHDEWMCEMAETKGCGYGYLGFQEVDPESNSCDDFDKRRCNNLVHKLKDRFSPTSEAYADFDDGTIIFGDELPF